MWYVMESDADASLRSGLKQQITPEQYKEMVENDTITEALSEYPVKEGDVFFLPAGRIHSIGAGCFLAEIQETSDVPTVSMTLSVRMQRATIASCIPRKLLSASIIPSIQIIAHSMRHVRMSL